MPLAGLVPTLQLAIGPVILISGVGLLLLSRTNRQLACDLATAAPAPPVP